MKKRYKMPFKISVDKEKCIGCGACAAVCSENFEVVEGKAKPKKSEVDEIGCCKEAEDTCPVHAIKVEKI